jgi:hypothetical protein
MRARRIPSSWVDGVARLDHHRPLTDIAPHRWRQFLSDCNNFLTGGENWAGRAAELGWNAASLFGRHRARPSRILVVPVCYGPSRAVGSSNYIEIGQSSHSLDLHRLLGNLPAAIWICAVTKTSRARAILHNELL